MNGVRVMGPAGGWRGRFYVPNATFATGSRRTLAYPAGAKRIFGLRFGPKATCTYGGTPARVSCQ
jgi:hypothetical protein